MKHLLLLSLLAQAFIAEAAGDPFGKGHHTREYLGSVKNTQGQPVYHLINHFYTVQAAIVAHGHSEMLFYDRKWRLVASYTLDLPDGLPVLLRRNTLYFQSKDQAEHVVRSQQVINPAAPPPKCICILPKGNDCYFR